MILNRTNCPSPRSNTKVPPVLLAALAGILLTGCAATAETQTGPSASSGTAHLQQQHNAREDVLHQLAERLETGYLFPDWGAAYAAHLRGRVLTDAEVALSDEDFATLVTDELQAIYPDGHLRLDVMEEGGEDDHHHGPPPPSNFAAHHADGVSYMRIDIVFGMDETMAQLEEFVSNAAPGDTIIIDLRENRGGGLREMDFLFSEMFAEPTDLVVMEIREVIYENDGAPFGGAESLHRIDAPDGLVHHMHRSAPASPPRLADHNVVVLTSGVTGSAAEHITMALQRTGRATVIGEPSRGAAHFGGMLPVGHGFAAFIPAGRTFNPDTGESWEGTGNQPDIAADADAALMVALARAGLSAEQAMGFRDSIPQP